MSKPGVESNRGDQYQLAIAMLEVLSVLNSDEVAWLEVESTFQIRTGEPIPVDDVVVRYVDGRMVCIQCKKNSPEATHWTVAELKVDLLKAATLLLAEPDATVRFYSRADFRFLAQLANAAQIEPNDSVFLSALSGQRLKAYEELSKLWFPEGEAGMSALHLLRRIRFTPTDEVDKLHSEVKGRLSQHFNDATVAFNALWTMLASASARISDPTSAEVATHRISKAHVLERLAQAGSSTSPRPTATTVKAKFAELSAVGRHWPRDIDGTMLDRDALGQLTKHVRDGAKTVLLVDGAGSGKTCVLLELIDQLESDETFSLLFLQAREFAQARDAESRAALGLSADIVRMVSTMAAMKRVVVVIDSLDVLSLARDNEGLSYFLSLIDRFEVLENVTVVAACRDFDLRFNKRLASRAWAGVVRVGLLEWEAQVLPMLARWGVDVEGLDEQTVKLLRNPRSLAMYQALAKRSAFPSVATVQGLTEKYLDEVVGMDPRLGDEAMRSLEVAAAEMMVGRALALPRSKLPLGDERLARLLSENVLIQSGNNQIGFGHQTLLDALTVRDAIRRGLTLLDFIRGLRPVPFVRPAIRAFAVSLRLSDSRAFVQQLRVVFDSDVAWHIKRLLAETLAEFSPSEDDWRLLQHLQRKHIDLFRCVFSAATEVQWFHLWCDRAVPVWLQAKDADWLLWAVRRFADWYATEPVRVLDFWMRMVTSDVLQGRPLRSAMAFDLSRLEGCDWRRMKPLIEGLMLLPPERHDYLGKVVHRLIEAEDGNDGLLWRFVSERVQTEDAAPYEIGELLRLEHHFLDETFFKNRMRVSDTLLDEAVSALEKWSADNPLSQGLQDGWNQDFRDYTSFAKTHSKNSFGSSGGGEALLQAVEESVLYRAEARQSWWRSNAKRLCFNSCGALRYIGLRAFTEYPDDPGLAQLIVADSRHYRHADPYELGLLIRQVAVAFPDLVQDIEENVLRVRDDFAGDHPEWVRALRRKLILQIPAHLRSECAQIACHQDGALPCPTTHEPEIYSFGGFVASPVSEATLAALSGPAVLELLAVCEALDTHQIWGDGIRGGPSQIAQAVYAAATNNPARFLRLLDSGWPEIPARFREAMFSGIALHIRQTKGDVQPPTTWNPVEADADVLAKGVLEELERHPLEWQSTGEAASALDGCAHVLYANDEYADRIVFCAVSLAGSRRMAGGVHGSDLITKGLNDVRGKVAEAMMVLASKRLELGLALPVLLSPLLMRLALDESHSTPALMLRRLPFVQSKSELGWSILDAIMERPEESIWHLAEECFGYFYRDHWNRIQPMLGRLASSTEEKSLVVWGRIAALAARDGLLPEQELLSRLKEQNDASSWYGAVEVWASSAVLSVHSEVCLRLLTQALDTNSGAAAVKRELHKLLVKAEPPLAIPAEFLQRVLERAKDGVPFDFFGWDTWCTQLAEVDPDMALDAAEVITRSKADSLELDGELPKLLGTLLDEAESRELADGGVMLQRVLALQDWVVKHSLGALDAWLRAAERPLH